MKAQSDDNNRAGFALRNSFDLGPSNQLPDPFQLDDPDDPISDEEENRDDAPFGTGSQRLLIPAETDVPLQYQQETKHSPVDTTTDLADKPQPPLPPEDPKPIDETPQLNVPGIINPGLFQPIHAVDPLNTLLTKYIADPNQRPPRDSSGAWRDKEFHTLVMTNSWRALANMACDRIIHSSPTDLGAILELWYLRLSCLARLRLFNQTTSECNNLYAVLNRIEPPSAREYLFDNVLPFELEVLYARLRYWAGDHLGYLDALMPLLNRCKQQARDANDDLVHSMWKERGARITLTIASQLIEMNDMMAAARLLEPLCQTGHDSPELFSAIARVYLQSGHLKMASKYFSLAQVAPTVDEVTKAMNNALEAMAHGQWNTAIEALRRVLKSHPNHPLAANNLAVALLCTGKVTEGTEIMERALQALPLSVTTTEPWIFNLATLYELRSTTARDKKCELLVSVAKWGGDGLKASCLKLPNT